MSKPYNSLGEYLIRSIPEMREELDATADAEAAEQQARRKRRVKPSTIQARAPSLGDAISFMGKAHSEAYSAAIEEGADHSEAMRVGNHAWRSTLPLLSSRTAVHIYIGCVAHGLSRGYLTTEEARTMMYSAQMALAVMKGEK